MEVRPKRVDRMVSLTILLCSEEEGYDNEMASLDLKESSIFFQFESAAKRVL